MNLNLQLADEESYQALGEPSTIEQAVQQRDRALNALSVMAEAVSTQLSVDAVLHKALEQTLATLEVKAGAITLLNEQTNMLQFRAQQGWQVHNFVQEGICVPADKGMSGIVIRTGKPVATANVDQDRRIIVDAFRDEPVKAMIMAPMRARGRVLGVLSAMSYQPRRFTQDEVALLIAIGNQIGVAVDNARLYEQEHERLRITELHLSAERRRAEDMALLRDTLVHMAGTNDLPDMLEYLTQAALKLSQATVVEVDFYAATSNRMTLGMALHENGSRRPLCTAPHRNSLAAEAVKQKHILQRAVNPEGEYLSNIEFIIAMPMVQKNANGAILLGYQTETELDQQTYSSLQLLADQAALALERLRLYAQERRKATYLMLVNRISQAAVEKLRHETLLVRIVSLIQQGFGLFNVSLYMGTPLTLKASSGGDPVTSNVIIKRGLPILAAQEKRPLLANNIEDDERCEAPPWVAEHAQAEIAVPLLNGEKVNGVLDLFSIDPYIFDAMDVETMSTLANQLAVILENGELYTQMKRQLTELAALYEVTRAIAQPMKLEAVLQGITSSVYAALEPDACFIALLDKNKKLLTVRAAVGESTHWQKCIKLPKEYKNIDTLPQKNRPIHITDMQAESFPFEFNASVRSLIMVLLLSSQEEIIGVLVLTSHNPHNFSGDDERLIAGAASQASVAIEKARLYEHLAQHNRSLNHAYEELKELTNTKDTIVQNISHELRTPLTYIKGYIDLLGDQAVSISAPESQQIMELITRKTEEVIKIVNEIVAVDEYAAAELNHEPVVVQALLDKVLEIHQEEAAQKSIIIQLQAIVPDLKIYGDQERLIQLCSNILDNAIKFSPDGGNIWIGVKTEQTLVHLTFRDQGIGIPRNQLKNIFETFYQVDSSPTRRFGGLGIGLAVVRRIAEAHKGMVWAESEVGQGSTFHVLLPGTTPSIACESQPSWQTSRKE
ncbi:MAG: GAF domain-containing protein [Anaerolineae bacterium]|nr:GAF domain-containing protein [Anaerolineae bacterium]